jgi:uncharacterized protein with FMN-binding domain
MRRTIPALLAATMAAVPFGVGAWAAGHPTASKPVSGAHARATATARARATATARARAAATARARATATARARATATAVAAADESVTVQGPSVDMQWGPVQVTVIIKGQRLVDVQATAPTERARSNFINSQAIPYLRQETLQAQSANIDLISGATMTSQAFDKSLQAALDQAHFTR